jgi:hypothetical protein
MVNSLSYVLREHQKRNGTSSRQIVSEFDVRTLARAIPLPEFLPSPPPEWRTGLPEANRHVCQLERFEVTRISPVGVSSRDSSCRRVRAFPWTVGTSAFAHLLSNKAAFWFSARYSHFRGARHGELSKRYGRSPLVVRPTLDGQRRCSAVSLNLRDYRARSDRLGMRDSRGASAACSEFKRTGQRIPLRSLPFLIAI